MLVAEGVGGLLVPLSGNYLVRDLAADLGMPVVIAARPGLGTISHTLMTIECARAAGLEVAGVVLTPWPAQPGEMERSNRETIARLGERRGRDAAGARVAQRSARSATCRWSAGSCDWRAIPGSGAKRTRAHARLISTGAARRSG